MLFPYIPYLYFIHTRIHSKAHAFSWVIVYFLPLALLLYAYELSLVELIISCYAINLIYENGYIQNDVLTARREDKPTLRLSNGEDAYIYNNLLIIFSFRMLIALALFAALYHIVERDAFVFFVLEAVALQGLFLLYNKLRSRANLYLILPLSFLRFYAPVVFFFLESNVFALLCLFFIYPVPKFLEFTKQPRYGYAKLARLVGNIDLFRVIYYSVVTSILGVLVFYGFEDIKPIMCISLFYLCYRSIAYTAIRYSQKLKELAVSGAKKSFRD